MPVVRTVQAGRSVTANATVALDELSDLIAVDDREPALALLRRQVPDYRAAPAPTPVPLGISAKPTAAAS